MSDPVEQQGHDSFEARLAAARAKVEPEPRDVAAGALARGTRHAFEIAATTVVGAAIGLYIDRWAGTKPWGFLLLMLLGIAAGFWNLMKAVNAEAAAIKDAAEAEENSNSLNDQGLG